MESKILKFIIFLSLTFISNTAWSLNLVEGAKIKSIISTNWNEKVFTVVLEGGTGVCANGTLVFPEEYSQSTVAYSLTFSMAMSAYIHNKRISAHNYNDRKYKNDDVCTGASLLSIQD